jgi:uncharacterized protein (TIGR02996 family)
VSDEAAFLAAIRAAPDDDTARLVFADWLDERDRLGGAFLRAEVELSRVPFDAAAWSRAFARYRAARAPLPEAWREAAERHPLAHWLAQLTRGAWARLERWCRDHHPGLSGPGPGATVAQIDALERTIGQQLPADVREWFALRNGCVNLMFGTDSVSTEGAEHYWNMWRRVAGHNEEFRECMEAFPPEAVAVDYTNAGWVPLTSAGSNHIGIDLAPGPKGVRGQVIIFGRDEDEKCVLADSWGEFLSDYATFLESGAVRAFDPNTTDPSDWFDGAMGIRHPYDALRNMRKNGTWPPKPATDGE